MQLDPLEAEPADSRHTAIIERAEDEYFVRIEHPMTKSHYISFAAAVSANEMQMVKLYPEGNAETRFKSRGVRKIIFFCNRDGLFSVNPISD